MTNKNVYQIFSGQLNDEFYTFDLPCLDSERVTCFNLIKKGEVVENIMGKTIIEFFKLEVMSDEKTKKNDMVFDLNIGFVVKLLSTETLTWLERTEEEAKQLLKDKVLQYYQTLVPELVENMKSLQEQLTKRQDIQLIEDDEIYSDYSLPKKRKNLLIP